jgi:Tfp pilus assembly protein PilO
MKSANRLIVAMLAVVAIAVAFWVLALSPKRQEASELASTAQSIRSSIAGHRQEVVTALEARRTYASDYGQLVVLGKAVPVEDDTASLLVQLNRIADKSHVRFQEILLADSGGEGAAPVAAPEAGTASPETAAGEAPVAPTELAAATLPLGAAIGPAGLGVMPYSLKFTGDFVHVADFIHGLDSLVKTNNENVAVNGRLITINGFSLGPQQGESFPHLEANFSVTAYLTPPTVGVTAGATPETPEGAESVPAATVTGGTP